MKWQWRLLAILGIIGLEAFALSRDIDGVAIAIAILVLAGLGVTISSIFLGVVVKPYDK